MSIGFILSFVAFVTMLVVLSLMAGRLWYQYIGDGADRRVVFLATVFLAAALYFVFVFFQSTKGLFLQQSSIFIFYLYFLFLHSLIECRLFSYNAVYFTRRQLSYCRAAAVLVSILVFTQCFIYFHSMPYRIVWQVQSFEDQIITNISSSMSIINYVIAVGECSQIGFLIFFDKVEHRSKRTFFYDYILFICVINDLLGAIIPVLHNFAFIILTFKLFIIFLVVKKEYDSIIRRCQNFFPNYNNVRLQLYRIIDKTNEMFTESDIYLINLIKETVNKEVPFINELKRDKKIANSDIAIKILNNDQIV